MRYALISDVHANLPALDAVLDDIDTIGVDAVCHLGDLVGYAPWPNEVVARIAERAIPGVAGNYDSTVAANYSIAAAATKIRGRNRSRISPMSGRGTTS